LPSNHNCGLEIFKVLHKSEASDEILDTIHLERASANIQVALAYGVRDLRQTHVVGAHRFGVDVDLILADEPTDRGDLANPLDRLQGVANGPVLDAAQLVGVPATNGAALWVLALEGVPEDLPQGGGIRAKRGGDAIRDRSRRKRRELLEHPRAGPIELDVVVEDDVDRGESKSR